MNIFKNIFSKVKAACNNISEAVRNFFVNLSLMLRGTLSSCTGDLATNTIGGIIVAVVIIGLLIVAIKAFFPGFFTSMFNAMESKLNANW